MRPVSLGLLAFALAALPAVAQTTNFRAEFVTAGLSRPVVITAPRNDTERLFIVEQHRARIRIVRNGLLQTTPFLQGIAVRTGNEQGLLGLAFHPNYAQNGLFYVNYTDTASRSVIAEYSVDPSNPDLALSASRRILLTVSQPFSNHNGGCIAFGPDGYLYISLGDGGSGNDPRLNGQNINSLLGKLLRIDVDTRTGSLPYGIPASNPFVGVPGRDEIWAWGLRNVWKFSFDRLTGDLIMADVGQNVREEVNFEAAGSPGGLNYGWRCYEGTRYTALTGCTSSTAGLEMPVIEYPHTFNSAGGFSITGGVVYRGNAIPGLQGTYFLADYVTDNVWTSTLSAGSATPIRNVNTTVRPAQGQLANISAFGEDAAGEVYIANLSGGQLFKLVPRTSVIDLSLSGPATIGARTTLDVSAPTLGGNALLAGYSLAVQPGQPVADGRIVPLAFDDLLVYSLTPNPVFENTTTTSLDAGGQASFGINIPNVPSLVGTKVYGAVAVLNASASAGIAAIASPLTITVQ